MRAFRFVQTNGGHFRLVVLAPSLRAAREYVKGQALSSITHRTLKYVGRGHPPNPVSWCAAVAQRRVTNET